MDYARFEKLCQKNGTSPTALSKKLGLSKGNTSNWKNGGNPSVEVLCKIADELNCTTDYLLGRTDTPDMTANIIEKPSISNSNFGTVNGNVTGNISNAIGEAITINNGAVNGSGVSDEYAHFISTLDGLGKWDRKHAVLEIEQLLEERYSVKKNSD